MIENRTSDAETELILLQSKCRPPFIAAAVVPRPRLFRLLDGWQEQRLTAVIAPAGYGKTTLVASWLRSRQAALAEQSVDVIWISLEEQDEDPHQFLTLLCAAVKPALHEVSTVIAHHLQQPSFDTLRLIKILLNGIAQKSNTFLLVIDDCQHINNSGLYAALKMTLHHGPANLHLMLLSRKDLSPDLDYLSIVGNLRILGLQELRFQEEEVGSYLERKLNWGQLSAGELSALVERSEGWVMGIELAALRLSGDADLGTMMALLHGRNQWIARYFHSELLDSLPPQIQTFLLETSILERLSAPLCLAVTGLPDAPALLEQAVALKLFIIPSDPNSLQFSYHALFRYLLRSELARRYPLEKVQILHQRAGAWLAKNDEIGTALAQYLQAKLHTEAVALVEQHLLQVALDGDFYRGERWLKMLHSNHVALSLRLILDETWCYVLADRGDVAAILQSTEAAWQRLAQLLPAGSLCHEERLMQWALAKFNEGNKKEALELAEQVAASMSERTHFLVRGACYFIQFLTRLQSQTSFDEPNVARMGYQALQIYEENGWFIGMVSVTRALSNYVRQKGNGKEALALGQHALNLIKLSQQDLALEAIYIHNFLAYVLYNFNQLREFEDELRHLLDRAKTTGNGDWLFIGQIMSSLHKMASGEVKTLTPEKASPDWRRRLLDVNSNQVKVIIQTWLIRLFILAGNRDEAWDTAQYTQVKLDGSPHDYPLQEKIVYASGYLARGTNLPLLKPILAELEGAYQETDFLEYQLQLAVLQAWYWLQQGDEGVAEAYLDQALNMVEQTGYVRYVLDIPDLRPLLAKSQHSCLQQYQDLARAALAAADSLEFSERELAILRLLAQKMKNREIADELFISEATVKWHLWSVYRRLGVKNRRAAVSRAREFSLIA